MSNADIFQLGFGRVEVDGGVEAIRSPAVVLSDFMRLEADNVALACRDTR